MFKRLRHWFALRNVPLADLKELNYLLNMSGRRVTHDLDHALSTIHGLNSSLAHALNKSETGYEYELNEFSDRTAHWRSVFYPCDGGKNYRLKQNYHITELEKEIDRLKKLCDDNNISYDHPDSIPF